MKKRGQITIFVIVGVMFAAMIIFFFVLWGSREPTRPDDVEDDGVRKIVEDHIAIIARTCLDKIGFQGGYDTIPPDVSSHTTSFWYHDGVNIQPLLGEVESEMDICLDRGLNDTVDIVRDYLSRIANVEINVDAIRTSTSIADGFVNVNVIYPVTITRGGSTSRISSFRVEQNVDFNKMYSLSSGIVNFASTADFDRCDPARCGDSETSFTFMNDGKDLVIRGATPFTYDDETSDMSDLYFTIRRPVREAFGEDKKRMAVLYQDDEDWPTFGGRTMEILKDDLGLTEGVDYFGCDDIPGFFDEIDTYDVVIITGTLQFQIVKMIQAPTSSSGGSGDDDSGNNSINSSLDISGDRTGTLLFGCNSFNPQERKIALKNWINNGGILWVNNVAKYETDSFVLSYLGSLGYTMGAWETVGMAFGKEMLQMAVISLYNNNRKSISEDEILNPTHPILTCPYNIVANISGMDYYYSLKTTDKDEVIIGNDNGAMLWTREIGNGAIVFDEFFLKDNLYSRMDGSDDLDSKEIAWMYYTNVVNYLAKFPRDAGSDEYSLTLTSPVENVQIEEKVFVFESDIPTNGVNTISIIDHTGSTIEIELDDTNSLRDGNSIVANLTDAVNWSSLESDRYEWNVLGSFNNEYYFSDYEGFVLFQEEVEEVVEDEEAVVEENDEA